MNILRGYIKGEIKMTTTVVFHFNEDFKLTGTYDGCLSMTQVTNIIFKAYDNWNFIIDSIEYN